MPHFLNSTALEGMQRLNVNLDVKTQVPFMLIHSDLPFNTNKVQKGGKSEYDDSFGSSEDFYAFLVPHIELMRRLIHPNGLLALQLDDREHMTLRRACDQVMGTENYRGTLIWHYETGSAARKWWSLKHQYIVLYSSGRGEPQFHTDQVPTIPRKSAPKSVVNAKGESVTYSGDKRISSVWNMNWSTTDPQRTGYPSQKPLCIAETLIRVHTSPGDWVLDPFCGSGTTVVAAHQNQRQGVGIDKNHTAVEVAKSRIA